MSQHIVITGANRGIGLGFVNHYLKQGMRVTACHRVLPRAATRRCIAAFKSTVSTIKLGETGYYR
ncbi:SDR family NAD(P)-dependent oxidoreductase [Shewanella algidipiscicola]|uniref:Uncharacterized protein n=1 Tax=Shewanella algidipiscicola TaxID=614070 RepID=A0ABQ4PI64_9GAMM|nr:SDR family NAD(P)-dependent oxidoreductase [Shewanella algidipiscicola]GIU47129.1 hypothetical protein TUM4630_19980 [Shewanella algidipiscicola]